MNIICIYSFKESNWISCQKIVFNLLESYKKLENVTVTSFNYDQNSTIDDFIPLCQVIEDVKPQKIIFLDHKPHPLKVIQVLKKNLDNRMPELVFHLFGDFTLYYSEWHQTESLLLNHKVTFIVPSERQKHLIDKFFKSNKCQICPFPVIKEQFFFEKSLRDKQRREWNVQDKTKVFVYTGRLSRQKRIHTLIKAFSEASISNPDAQLYLYGQFDHIGDRFLNIWENEGEYTILLLRTFERLPDDVKRRIHFMGNVDWLALKSVYAGADYFISLSVHNDEDYGMSVAEAQACGLPCIITNWGGFSSFNLKEYPEAVKFIGVKIGQYQKLVSKSDTIALIKDALSTENLPDRTKIYNLSMAERSIESASSKLKIILKSAPKFEGYSDFLKAIVARIEFHQPIYLNKKNKISSYYRRIYESYIRHN